MKNLTQRGVVLALAAAAIVASAAPSIAQTRRAASAERVEAARIHQAQMRANAWSSPAYAMSNPDISNANPFQCRLDLGYGRYKDCDTGQ